MTSLNNFRSAVILYALVCDGGADPGSVAAFASSAEPYDNQTVYEIYWRVNLGDSVVETVKGQPTELFGIRGMIEAAMDESEGRETETNGFSFDEIKKGAQAGTAYKPSGGPPVVTYAIAAANVIVMIFMYLGGYPDDPAAAARFGAIVPELILYENQYYRLFTAMFVHFGAMHLLMNMMGLMIFGIRVERYYGRLRYICVYIISGLAGSLFSLFFTRGYAAGASGAVYGLTGAVLAYTLISKRPMDALTSYTMIIFAGIGFAMGFSAPGVDNFGHIGGWLAGALAGAALTKGIKNKD
jgi:rhomboid protease GluP